MMPSRRDRVKEVFRAALDVPAGQRARFLEEACAGDPTLRAEAADLLAQDERADREGFLNPLGLFATAPAGGADPSRVGQRLGPYDIKRQIGEGGMGTVYLAERWRDYHQQVAVKFLKGGLDLQEFLQRFQAERLALANPEHPNVARLLDGGTTDDGVPFLVLEYVAGQPLDRYCDAHQLNVRQRLELLLAICAAVQHAHAHDIIHRDLKPRSWPATCVAS